jgi:hypothetical protein
MEDRSAVLDGRLIAYGLRMPVFTFACLIYHDWVRSFPQKARDVTNTLYVAYLGY